MGLCALRRAPAADQKLLHLINKLHIKQKDLDKIYAKFRKYDKDRSGTIDVAEFYHMIEEKRTVFGDGIFELIDIDDTGTLDFSEFCVAIFTYGFFEELETLKCESC